MKCYIWSTALYGAETWSLRKVDQKYLKSFKMWCWCRMQKISWSGHVGNKDILQRVQKDRNRHNNLQHHKHQMNAYLLHSYFAVLTTSRNRLILLKTSCDVISLATHHILYHVTVNGFLPLVRYFYTVFTTRQFTFSSCKKWASLELYNTTFNFSVKMHVTLEYSLVELFPVYR